MVVLFQKVYRFVWDKDSSKEAQIYFIRNDERPKQFMFTHCNYSGMNVNKYTLDDWEFLGELAAEVLRLTELEVVNG